MTARRQAPDDSGLAAIGLRSGEDVRWRTGEGAHWRTGTVSRRERDGSIGVTDSRGLARSIPVERLHVRRRRAGWEPLTDRASRTEQLRLL